MLVIKFIDCKEDPTTYIYAGLNPGDRRNGDPAGSGSKSRTSHVNANLNYWALHPASMAKNLSSVFMVQIVTQNLFSWYRL